MISVSYYLRIRREMRDLLKLYPVHWDDFYAKLFMHIRLWFNRFDTIEQYLPREGTIIDLGCGYGFFSNLLALRSLQRTIIGIEKNKRKVQYARRGLPNVQFVIGDVFAEQFNHCAGVCLIDLLHHLSSYDEQEQLLNKCYQALEPNGILLIKEIGFEPAYKFFLTRQVDFLLYRGDHFYFRDHPTMKALLQDMGFAVEYLPLHAGIPYSSYGLVCTKK